MCFAAWKMIPNNLPNAEPLSYSLLEFYCHWSEVVVKMHMTKLFQSNNHKKHMLSDMQRLHSNSKCTRISTDRRRSFPYWRALRLTSFLLSHPLSLSFYRFHHSLIIQKHTKMMLMSMSILLVPKNMMKIFYFDSSACNCLVPSYVNKVYLSFCRTAYMKRIQVLKFELRMFKIVRPCFKAH